MNPHYSLTKRLKLSVKTLINIGRSAMGADDVGGSLYNRLGSAKDLQPEQVDGYIARHIELRPILQWCLDFVEESIRHHKDRGRILDYGCGTGRYLKRLSHNGNYELLGIDQSQATLDNFTRPSLPDAHLFCLDLTKDNSFADRYAASFDVIYSISVLEHIPPSKIRTFLKSLAYLLKPGGLLILGFPHPDSYLECFSNIAYVRWWPASIESRLRKEGMTIIHSGCSVTGRRISRVARYVEENQGYWIKAIKR